MNPCSCAGINVTWACNASCKHCFYRRNPNLHKNTHKSLFDIITEMESAKARGCNRIVLIGEGEPMLHPDIEGIILAAKTLELYTNIITNGTLPISKYKTLFDRGLNHLQISAHATGFTLDEIMDYQGAAERQEELMDWLKENNLPFRTNTSLQQLNYKRLPETIDYLINKGSFHIALLGFLPHYEWKDHASEVAVHPAELRPFIEKATSLLLDAGKYFTIRYHPFCHLAPKYWKYIVNARYVLYDPFEWDYNHFNPSPQNVWPAALAMGENVAIQGAPCEECLLRLHCGGWNRFYAEAFKGADLRAIKEIPLDGFTAEIGLAGGLHVLNPANNLAGYCLEGKPV